MNLVVDEQVTFLFFNRHGPPVTWIHRFQTFILVSNYRITSVSFSENWQKPEIIYKRTNKKRKTNDFKEYDNVDLHEYEFALA